MSLISRALVARSGGHVKPARPLDRVPRVSVVIPCYNYGRYLPKCAHSALDQPGVDVEVIIVDDKSTDDSLAIARSLESEDRRVHVIEHTVNKGHIATYNEGLDAVTGEFVILLSADDLLTEGALARGAALLAREETVGFVYGAAVPFLSDPPPCRTNGTTWITWSGVDWLRARSQSGYNVVSSPEVMMRTSVLRKIGGYRADLPHAGDFEMWLRASAVADVGYLVGVDQAYYRKHAVNMHKQYFHSGTARGQLVDLTQRWKSFEAVLGEPGRNLEGRECLLTTARQTMARQALDHANYAYARGTRAFPVVEFEQLALDICADAGHTKAGRALARRKRLGMSSLPLHPLWAKSAIAYRVEALVRFWLRRRVGL